MFGIGLSLINIFLISSLKFAKLGLEIVCCYLMREISEASSYDGFQPGLCIMSGPDKPPQVTPACHRNLLTVLPRSHDKNPSQYFYKRPSFFPTVIAAGPRVCLLRARGWAEPWADADAAAALETSWLRGRGEGGKLPGLGAGHWNHWAGERQHHGQHRRVWLISYVRCYWVKSENCSVYSVRWYTKFIERREKEWRNSWVHGLTARGAGHNWAVWLWAVRAPQ